MWYISYMANFTLYFDGSCWPNPGGTAGFGYTLLRTGQSEPIDSGSGVVGIGNDMTNNLAEFWALAQGLASFLRVTGNIVPDWNEFVSNRHHLSVYGDSNLVVQVMNKHWKARPERGYYDAYIVAAANAKTVRKQGHTISFDWVPREMNTICDDLSKAHQKKV